MTHKISNENRKLYWVVAIFLLLGVILVSVSYVGDRIQVGIRGYISGEAEWSKAQKQSTIALFQYLESADENYFNHFTKSLEVIYGNRMAREELSSASPDHQRAREGFLKGNNHPEEVNAMIWVFQNFSGMEEIQESIQHWERGDSRIDEIVELADSIRQRFLEGDVSADERSRFYGAITVLDNLLTEDEQLFSNAMSAAARRAGQLVFWSMSSLSVLLILLAAFTAVSFMRGYKTANAKLRESEQKFKNVLDHSRDVIYQINIGAEKYDYMSTSVKTMLGFTSDEVMEGGPGFILGRTHPEDIARMKKKIKQLESVNVEEKLTHDTEFRVKRADGSYIWVNNKRSLLRDKEGQPAAIVGNVRDITVHKRQMEKLDKSLVEKQTLLAEIHHRVKNNLAIVSSLIELQKDGVEPDVKSSFRDVQSRIKSIALIHEKLYENTIFSEVVLSAYLRELAEMISNTYRSKQKAIDILFDLEDVKVDMTLAVPVGLICNELINNSFKHAFDDSEKGEICIKLKSKGNFATVTISDNGKGLPEDFNLNDAGGLGVTLLNVLTMQIEGELSFKAEPQTSFELLFPLSADNKKAEVRSA